MIAFLQGALVEKHPTRVVLEAGGIGYEIFIPLSSYDRLPAGNGACRLLIHDHVREDCHQLFGFMTEAERRLFLLLMGVSGVGPKIALSALSGLSVRELTAAIAEGDARRLTSVSGVGRKMAERIVVELRDRIGAGEALEAVAGATERPEQETKLRDAVMALVSLGYKQAPARKMVADAVRGGAEDRTVEEIVRSALSR